MHGDQAIGGGACGAWVMRVATAALAASIAAASATAAAQATQAQAQPQVVVTQPQPATVQYVQQPQPQVVQVYQPGQPMLVAQPVQRQQIGETTRANFGLIIPGAVLWGVGWVANFIVGLPAGDDPFRSGGASEAWTAFRLASLIPLAGPWVQLGVQPTRFEQDSWGMWLIIDGLLQLAGATMLFIGIATPQTVPVYADLGGGVELAVMPMAAPDRAGLSLVGRF